MAQRLFLLACADVLPCGACCLTLRCACRCCCAVQLFLSADDNAEFPDLPGYRSESHSSSSVTAACRHSLSDSQSVCLSVCLSVSQSVSQSVSLSVRSATAAECMSRGTHRAQRAPVSMRGTPDSCASAAVGLVNPRRQRTAVNAA
jgi:hypothetical protein